MLVEWEMSIDIQTLDRDAKTIGEHMIDNIERKSQLNGLKRVMEIRKTVKNQKKIILEETQKNLSINQSVEDIKIEGEEEINEQKIKYNYKTNLDEEMETVELDSEATVKTFQQFIGSKYSVSDYSTIQVLFAGKVLTDNIVLENLEVGDYPLFVYIRSTGEIFLKTAKANRVEYEYEYQYEEEEEEGNE